MTKIFWTFSLFNTANGLWMLLAPRSWYYGLPARIPDTGPLNVHFVRDIGAAFLTLGIAFCLPLRGPRNIEAWCWRRPASTPSMRSSTYSTWPRDAWTRITGSLICPAFFFPRLL
jgi:hypothetical protein